MKYAWTLARASLGLALSVSAIGAQDSGAAPKSAPDFAKPAPPVIQRPRHFVGAQFNAEMIVERPALPKAKTSRIGSEGTLLTVEPFVRKLCLRNHFARVAEWQTRWIQNPVSARA